MKKLLLLAAFLLVSIPAVGANVFITPYQDGVTTWSANDMNEPLLALDKAAGYHHNTTISSDGNVTYDKSTGSLAWSGPLRFVFVGSTGYAYENVALSGSITLADDEYAYVDLVEADGTTVVVGKVTMSTGSAATQGGVARLVLGYRNATSDDFYPVALNGVFGGGTAATTSATTTNFDGLLSGTDSDVQTALETLDDVTYNAASISTTTTNFDNNLSSADDTIQKALETLDEVAGSGGGSGHTIQNNYSNMAAQTNLNFVGFDVTNEPTYNATTISAPTNLSGIVDVPEVSEKESFTPTGTWTTNTTYTGTKWRVGNNLCMMIEITLSGAPNSASLQIDIPDGLSIDRSIFDDNGTYQVLSSSVMLRETGGDGYLGEIYINPSDATVIGIATLSTSVSPDVKSVGVNETVPFTFGNTDVISIYTEIPISGWNTSKQINVGKIPAMYAARVNKTSAQSIPGSTWTELTWNHTASDYSDHSDIFSGTNTQVIVPAGTDRGIVTVDLNSGATSSNLEMRILNNGTDAGSSRLSSAGAWKRNQVTSGVMDVTPGQAITAELYTPATSDVSGELTAVFWNSASPRASAFKGALVTRTTAQTITTATWTPVVFDTANATEEYDTGNFHDLVTNPSRLTVPAAVSRVRLAAAVRWSSDTTGNRAMYISKNGSHASGLPVVQVAAEETEMLTGTSGVVSVSEGDYFEFELRHTKGSDLATDIGLPYATWFSIEVIE